ncbi:hypothetical protein [uncultured Shewanella sp.]|uniref:hypothetical protein n=1 Tax=uncultured Shewanella sp. TaxID=173975 RepID=UPI00262D746B|nr:hypothetical protein [uncultured Shewanella sp.]
MSSNQGNSRFIQFLIPFVIAFLGSKVIFYYCSFEYSLLSDPFNSQKFLIDLLVFVGLFYVGMIVHRYVSKFKNGHL